MFLERASGVSMDAMHIVGGVLLLFGFAFVLRRPITHWLPWSGVLLAALVNEVSDLMVERWPNAAEQLGEGLKDLVWTMLLPTVLTIIARIQPRLLVRLNGTSGDREKGDIQAHPD